MIGKVTSVSARVVGDFASADATAGATTLFVFETSAFSPDGGTILIVDEVVNYSAIDSDLNSLTVSPLPSAVEADTPIQVYPYAESRWALVRSEDGSDGVFCKIPFEMQSFLVDGIREEGEEETAEYEFSAEEEQWVIVGIIDDVPMISSENIDSVPIFVPTEPPVESPAILHATGTTNGVVLHTEEVEPGTIIEFHVSTSSFVAVQGDLSTMVREAESQVAVVNALADGTPLLPDTDYYFQTFAYNVAGPSEAGPSAEVVGRLDLANLAELIIATIVAGWVLAGRIDVGQIFLTAENSNPAENGFFVKKYGGGFLLQIPSDGVTPIQATMQIVTDFINVQNNLSINGSAQLNGEMQMSNGVTNPTKSAILSKTYESVSTELPVNPTFGYLLSHGMCDWLADTDYFLTASIVGSGPLSARTTLFAFDKVTGEEHPSAGNLVTGKTWIDDISAISIATDGTHYYFLGWDDSRSGYYIFKIDSSYDKVGEIFVGATTLGVAPSTTTGALACYSGSVYMGWMTSAGDFKVRAWNTSTLAQSLAATTFDTFSTQRNVTAMMIGSFDGAPNRLYMGVESGLTNIRSYNLTTYAKDTTYEFYASNGNAKGIMYDTVSGRILTYDSDGTLHRYGEYPTAQTIKVKYAWLDDDATGGTHETLPTTETTFTLNSRGVLAVDLTDTPPDINNTDPFNTDKANKAAVYLTRDNWTTTRRAVFDGSEDWSREYSEIDSLATGTPKATNEFLTAATSTPGRFFSAATDGTDPLIDLKGSGEFRVGSYTSARHHSRRTRSADLTVATATSTDINFNSNIVTEGVTWDGANTRWQVNKPGVYLCSGEISWQDGNATGRRTLILRRYTGGAWVTIAAHDLPANAQFVTNHISVPVECEEGDYVLFQAFQNSGANRTVSGTDAQRCFGSVSFMGS
jgi:hypothetical protein